MHHSESHGHTAEAERRSRTRSLQPPLSPIKSNQKPPSANSDPTSANQRRMAQNHSGKDFELSSLYSLSFISRTDEPRDELLSRLPQKHTDTLNEHRHTLLWSLCGFSNEKLRHNRGTGQDETLLLGGSLLFISPSVPFIPETLKDTEMAGTLGIFGICLLFAGAHVTSGITVNIPQKVYKIARGDDVIIPCTFMPPATGSSVIVTWTASSDVPEDPDISIATYFDPTKITIFKKYKGRANLLHDVTKGQANLQLLKVTSADNLVYECKVEFPGDEEGSAFDKTRLVVLVAPSTPVCSIVGTAEYFQDIKLTCNSAEGTPTPTYKWESNDVNNIPRPIPLKNKEENGVLSLFNISKDTSGYFFCTSTNEIRSAKCNVTLAVLQLPFIPETLKDTEMAGTLGIFGICLLFAGAHVTSGITVNIPQKVYKIARGDDVTIPCTFTPPATGSSVIVTWTASSDVPEDPDISIATYFDPTKITIFKKYKGRANLLHDVTKGQANLQLLKVTSADNLVYECKVEFPGDEEGSASAKTRLVVLVAPSTPVCSIVGTAEYFQDIKLTCNSAEGTPTPTYKWESNDVNNIPRPLPLKNKEENGVLSLFNISKDTSGYFFCTSTNEIRSAKCNVTLAVLQPSLTLGSAGTIAIGVAVAALVVFVGIIICCCYCRRRKGKEEEYSMGTPEGGEFTDKDPEGREDDHDKHVNYEEERRVKSADRRDPQDDRSERSYDRRSDYDDRKDNYADRRDDRSDRRDRDDRYDDRRDDRSDRRDRDDRDDRRDDRSNRRDRDDRDDRYDARRDRYDDRRDDRRDHYDDRYDSDRYSERYDSRDRPPSVPPNKPKEPRN
ncbi:hypothetical protein Q8A67_004261 [Cirrhinus molitorella]|uniref:Ig-like domain-containing protein n=1 Tax=Cirrhinus molitorella TaxID=172907 RepID=A0AA88Q0H4_9TELE|nr:hypothetical protein Q8A67_004261 [Cirrhinus molitorella]